MRTTKPEGGILLVGDAMDGRHSLLRALQKAGHAVHLATDGMDGLRVLGEGGIRLLICDHGTPAMRGVDLLSLVRERYPHIAQIAFVDKARFDAEAGVKELGECCQVLPWPCSQVQIKGAVYLALQTAATQAENRQLVAALKRHIDVLDGLSRRLDFHARRHRLDPGRRPGREAFFLPARSKP